MQHTSGHQASSGALVATVNETMAALKIGRAKTYELINSAQLQSYVEGTSRKILWSSIHDYIERRLAEEARRRAPGRRD
jgi:hypothetical protein